MTCPMFQKSPLWNLMWMIRKSIWHFQFRILKLPIQDIETAAFKLTQDMERITAWCCINSLLLNPKKTKLLLLGTSQMLEKLSGTDFHMRL
jgi:hypothetical protein